MKHSLEDIILSLSNQELREFRYFIGAGHSPGEDREDLKLIASIRRGEVEQTGSGNAVHQTRKRIKKQLEQFALLENLHADDFSRIHALLETAKYLFRKNLHQQAWEYLLKAEQMAEQAEEYSLLDYCYNIQISNSYNLATPPPPGFSLPALLKKWEHNRSFALIDSNANAAYAHLIHELREQLSQQLSADIDGLTRRITDLYGLSGNVYDNNLRIYCRIVSLVCRALREKRDYAAMRDYAIGSYRNLEKKNVLDKISADFLIDLLDAICVAALRSKDYANCERFTRLYEQQARSMQAHAGEFSYYDFIPHIGVCDLCLCTGRLEEARMSMMAALKKYARYTASVRISFLLRINLMAVHFSAKEYELCIRLYNEIRHLNEKAILGEPGFRLELILFTEIYAILFYYEDGDPDYALYLLHKLKRKHASLLKRPDSKREHLFLRVVEQMLDKPFYTRTEKFRNEARQFIQIKEFIAGDFEYISMNAWLESKIIGRDYYSCFLELVG